VVARLNVRSRLIEGGARRREESCYREEEEEEEGFIDCL